MNNLSIKKIFFGAVILFTIDRIIKRFALKNLSVSESFLFTKNFGFQLFRNDKFAGIISLPNFVAAGIIVIFFILIIALLLKELRKGKRNGAAYLVMVLIGAASNALDRLNYKYVIDFFVIGPWVINLSDILIISGIILYLKKSYEKSEN